MTGLLALHFAKHVDEEHDYGYVRYHHQCSCYTGVTTGLSDEQTNDINDDEDNNPPQIYIHDLPYRRRN